VLAGEKDSDQDPQNEVTIMQLNGPLSFYGKFIYAVSDNVIAYPVRYEDYKYGLVTYSIAYTDIMDPSKNSSFEVLASSSRTNIVTDDAIYVQASNQKEHYKKHPIPKKSNNYEWINASDAHVNRVSQDDHFHCDNTIKPRRVKYISDWQGVNENDHIKRENGILPWAIKIKVKALCLG